MIALITSGIPSAVVIWWGNKKRRESHDEHQKGLDAAREREVELADKVTQTAEGLAAKVESSAQHVASKVEATKSETLSAIGRVDAAVKTGNDLKLGQMADANETRRIENIAEGDRTDAERDHIRTIPPKS
jgi:hypothetical protein